jgi:hypothetical protein
VTCLDLEKCFLPQVVKSGSSDEKSSGRLCLLLKAKQVGDKSGTEKS